MAIHRLHCRVIALTVLLGIAFSLRAEPRKKPIKGCAWSFQACLLYGIPRGDTHTDLNDFSARSWRDSDYSMLGMTATGSLSFSAGARVEQRLFRSVGVTSGMDISLRRSLFTRETEAGTSEFLTRRNSCSWRMEVPFYAGLLRPRWSIGIGMKVIFAEWIRNYRVTNLGDRYLFWSDDRIGGFVLQPSVRGTVRLHRSKRVEFRAVVEVDHRNKYYATASSRWVDVLVGCNVIL